MEIASGKVNSSLAESIFMIQDFQLAAAELSQKSVEQMCNQSFSHVVLSCD